MNLGQHSTDDMTGMQLLVNFLKYGKTFSLEKPVVRDTAREIPALLTLPKRLWDDKCLIANGPASMVFGGTLSDITRLLGEFKQKNRRWKEFVAGVHNFVPESPEQQFFLKVRLQDSTLRQIPAATVLDVFDDLSTRYREMYCDLLPYATLTLGVFFMKDCGKRVDESLDKITLCQLCVMFREFWEETIALTSLMFHGDALPHNIVVTDDKKLMLIDLDERTVEADVAERVIHDVTKEKYPYLRYPNFLRQWENAQLYTQSQLIASFLYLVSKITMDKESSTKGNKEEEKTTQDKDKETKSTKVEEDDKSTTMEKEKEKKTTDDKEEDTTTMEEKLKMLHDSAVDANEYLQKMNETDPTKLIDLPYLQKLIETFKKILAHFSNS
jgi:hypothetical protein